MGSLVEVMVNSKRVYAKGDLPRLVPPSVWWIAAGPFATEDPPALAVWVQFPVESLLLSSEFLCMQSFVYALQDWGLCFPQSYGSLLIKSHWPSRSNSLGIPSPFVGSQAGKPDIGFRTFITVGELLWYYCYPVCRSPTWWVWDLILLLLCPS